MNHFISIIVPALNAEKYMNRCLESLVSLDYPKDRYEIIIVDNGSSDGTVGIVKKYGVQIFTKDHCTISALRNYGASCAKGEILAFIDADCVAPKNWLKNAASMLEESGRGAVGCWYALPKDPAFAEKIWDVQMGWRRDVAGPADWVPSGDLIVKREVFEKVRGFNEALITAEDVDICERIQREGMDVFSHPVLAVQHLGNPKSVKEFFMKEYWRGKGVAQTFFKGAFKPEFLKAMVFAVLYLVCFIAAIAGAVLWVVKGSNQLLVMALAVSFCISLLLSVKAALPRKKTAYVLPLMFLFFVFGMSRGLALVNVKVLGIRR